MAKLVWPCADFSGIAKHAHASEGMAPDFPRQKRIRGGDPMSPSTDLNGVLVVVLWRPALFFNLSQPLHANVFQSVTHYSALSVSGEVMAWPHRTSCRLAAQTWGSA